MNDNIILIGFMGSGKTSVGKRLADSLAFSFLDTDEEIERQEGRRISALFETEGEDYFRKKETQTIRDMARTTQKTVISTGGGLPLREENRKPLQELGFVVYLDVAKETVLERLEGDTTRPLLRGEGKEERVEKLLSFRRPVYEYTAHMTVDTNQRDFDEIIDEIVRNYQIIIMRQKEKKENMENEVKSKNE